MKEKEADGSPVPQQYFSPLVKQDLAKLDKDGESRRTALTSLKHYVENLDPGSMPRFLAQVSESRDHGPSRPHAISLYEDVARVHGKLIIPHIPRVMATVTKSLFSSGSTPQLHQACAKVVTAVAKYSIDDSAPAQADAIVRELCVPLLDLIAGKLKPLAAGAACCLQALVESDQWKHANDEIVNDACVRTAVALGDKITWSVAHMQLACALSTKNPVCLKTYGVGLLRAGGQILRDSVSGSWQQRACAAKLLQIMLPLVDRATLASELAEILQVLECCKHDRMTHVRSAVGSALRVAKTLAIDESRRTSEAGGDLFRRAASLGSLSTDENSHKKPPLRRRSLWGGSDDSLSPPSKCESSPVTGSQESRLVSFSPTASSESSPSGGKNRRSPLYPTKLRSGKLKSSRGPSSVHSADGLDSFILVNTPLETSSKENVPSRRVDSNAVAYFISDGSNCVTPPAGRVGKYVRARPPSPGSYIPYPPSIVENGVTHQQSADIESSPVVMTKGRGRRLLSPLESSVLESFRETQGDLLAEDEDLLESDAGTRGIGIESDDSNSEVTSVRVINDARESLESVGNNESLQNKNLLGRPAMKQLDLSVLRKENVRAQGQFPKASMGACSNNMDGDVTSMEGRETLDDLCKLHARYNSLAHLSDLSSPPFSSQKSKMLITAEDFCTFNTPRRLVRSLQSQMSSSGSGSVGDQDMKSGDGGDVADMDLETSSEAGWSVRDNPIASDESFKTDSEEEDHVGEQKVHRKSMVGSSSDCHHGSMDEGDSPKSENPDRLSISSKVGHDCLSSDGSERTACPTEDVEIVKRTQQEENFKVSPQFRGGLPTLLCENEKSIYGSHEKEFEKLPCELGEEPVSLDDEKVKCVSHDYNEPKVLQPGSCISYFSPFRRGLGCIRFCAEVVLGGSLLVVLALPLAMALSKAFFTRAVCHGLVPT